MLFKNNEHISKNIINLLIFKNKNNYFPIIKIVKDENKISSLQKKFNYIVHINKYYSFNIVKF